VRGQRGGGEGKSEGTKGVERNSCLKIRDKGETDGGRGWVKVAVEGKRKGRGVNIKGVLRDGIDSILKKSPKDRKTRLGATLIKRIETRGGEGIMRENERKGAVLGVGQGRSLGEGDFLIRWRGE